MLQAAARAAAVAAGGWGRQAGVEAAARGLQAATARFGAMQVGLSIDLNLDRSLAKAWKAIGLMYLTGCSQPRHILEPCRWDWWQGCLTKSHTSTYKEKSLK